MADTIVTEFLRPSGLPDAGGCLLLIGQPPGMLIVLVAVWGAELRTGLTRVFSRAPARRARVLSGQPDRVERALNAWRIPRARNERTGDLSHPSLVYVIDPAGQIAYVLTGHVDRIVAAVRAL